MTSIARPSRGFTPLLLTVATLSMTTATLRLVAESRTNTHLSDSTSPPAPTASGPPEPAKAGAARDLVSPPAAVPAVSVRPREATAAAATVAPDPASPAAAAARARDIVRRSFENPNAKILEPVSAKRIGDGSSVKGVKRPRYLAEVVVEIPRGGGSIQREYLISLEYGGDGDWQTEKVEFATKF